MYGFFFFCAVRVRKKRKKKGFFFLSIAFTCFWGDQVRTISKPHSLVPFFFIFMEFCLACALQSQMKLSYQMPTLIIHFLRPRRSPVQIPSSSTKAPLPPPFFCFAARFLSSRWVRVRYNDIRSTLGALPSWLLFSGAQYESQLETVLGRFFPPGEGLGFQMVELMASPFFKILKIFFPPVLVATLYAEQKTWYGFSVWGDKQAAKWMNGTVWRAGRWLLVFWGSRISVIAIISDAPALLAGREKERSCTCRRDRMLVGWLGCVWTGIGFV